MPTRRPDSAPAEAKEASRERAPNIKLSREECETWAGLWQMISISILGNADAPTEGKPNIGMDREETLALAYATQQSSEYLPGYGKFVHNLLTGGKGLEGLFVPLAIIGSRVIMLRGIVPALPAVLWARGYVEQRAQDWRDDDNLTQARMRARNEAREAERKAAQAEESVTTDGVFATIPG